MIIAWIGQGFASLWHRLRGDGPNRSDTSALPRAERKRKRKEIIAQAKAGKVK